MTYEVKVTDQAAQNWQQAYEWYADRSPDAAECWYDSMQVALDSLKKNPERCPLADESSRFPIDLRQLNFGSGRKTTHRIIFAIRPDFVIVYAIRHVAQEQWRVEGQLGDS